MEYKLLWIWKVIKNVCEIREGLCISGEFLLVTEKYSVLIVLV